ncbi:hypothetical protein MRB53_004621 [Persea americana]|uniref:Uncharacterized protein n=1 Tax=Persea americana TaxID=3435 RepID=A0ACC2MBR1_PERAE|nr:hypothetical protein MRB53_004621 [Persea americana]
MSGIFEWSAVCCLFIKDSCSSVPPEFIVLLKEKMIGNDLCLYLLASSRSTSISNETKKKKKKLMKDSYLEKHTPSASAVYVLKLRDHTNWFTSNAFACAITPTGTPPFPCLYCWLLFVWFLLQLFAGFGAGFWIQIHVLKVNISLGPDEALEY